MGGAKIGIPGEGFDEQSQRLSHLIGFHFVEARHAAQEVVVRSEVLRRLALGAFDLGALQSRLDGAGDAGGHAVLHVEHIG